MIGRPFREKAKARGFTSNGAFRTSFNKLMQGRAKAKNVAGIDNAVGLGQLLASMKGKQNTRKTQPLPVASPVAAALQHSARNRSVEQGANRSTTTSSLGAALRSAGSIFNNRGA